MKKRALITTIMIFINVNLLAQSGMVLNLDGSDGSYIDVGNNSVFDITHTITLESWIKLDQVKTGWRGIVTKGTDDSWRLQMNNSGNLIEFSLEGLNFYMFSIVDVSDGNWYHVAGVFNGTTQYLYVNGVLDRSVSIPGTIYTTGYNVYIGGTHTGSSDTRTFNGEIDEVRIWNVARTQEEIQQNMNTTLSGSETGLVGYWNFDDGTENDLTPNGNDGSLFGNAQIVDLMASVESIELNPPETYRLFQNYPNPFNPSTTIEFALPKSEFVTLKIYNVLGEEIAILVNDNLQAGNHIYVFDKSNLSSGVYLYKINAGEFHDVRKMVLLR